LFSAESDESVVEVARFGDNFVLILLKQDDHRAAADLAIVVEFSGKLAAGRRRYIKGFEATRAGDGAEMGAHGSLFSKIFKINPGIS